MATTLQLWQADPSPDCEEGIHRVRAVKSWALGKAQAVPPPSLLLPWAALFNRDRQAPGTARAGSQAKASATLRGQPRHTRLPGKGQWVAVGDSATFGPRSAGQAQPGHLGEATAPESRVPPLKSAPVPLPPGGIGLVSQAADMRGLCESQSPIPWGAGPFIPGWAPLGWSTYTITQAEMWIPVQQAPRPHDFHDKLRDVIHRSVQKTQRTGADNAW